MLFFPPRLDSEWKWHFRQFKTKPNATKWSVIVPSKFSCAQNHPVISLHMKLPRAMTLVQKTNGMVTYYWQEQFFFFSPSLVFLKVRMSTILHHGEIVIKEFPISSKSDDYLDSNKIKLMELEYLPQIYPFIATAFSFTRVVREGNFTKLNGRKIAVWKFFYPSHAWKTKKFPRGCREIQNVCLSEFLSATTTKHSNFWPLWTDQNQIFMGQPNPWLVIFGQAVWTMVPW